VRDKVEKVIEVIRPAIQADEGDIVLHDVDEAPVWSPSSWWVRA
jgi:Fe-S cluster biogenesis protein NfuA